MDIEDGKKLNTLLLRAKNRMYTVNEYLELIAYIDSLIDKAYNKGLTEGRKGMVPYV